MKNNEFKFIFWGTPDVASRTLAELKKQGITPCLVITNPDRPKGRKMIITPSPVKVWATFNNIPVLQPEKLDDVFIQKLKSYEANMNLVVAYGQIIPKTILEMPKLGSINLHYSLLPKYRGASPVESTILNGETKTGVSIQKMEYKMDTGPVLAKKEIKINPDEKTEGLKDKLTKVGIELLIENWEKIKSEKLTEVKQKESEASYCKKITKQDGLIDIEKDSPEEIYNKWRAYHIWPRIFFFKGGTRYIVTDATLQEGKLKIKKVIPEGRKEVEWKE